MATKKTSKINISEPLDDIENVDHKVRYHNINIDGEKYRTLITENYKNRKSWVKPDVKKVYSQIPGTIVKVYIQEGQVAKQGELMLILEAMKMKNRLLFPINGIVKKIYVSEEERVPKGYLMVELE